jgi:hypothetical protein
MFSVSLSLYSFCYFGCFCYCCLYLLLLFIFYFLYGYSCYFFAFCEHDHANFWFGILFSVLPCLLFFLLLFIVFLGFNGSVNKASPNGPYCGFRADADSIGAMGKVREVCMRKFTCLLLHNFMVPCSFNLIHLLHHIVSCVFV